MRPERIQRQRTKGWRMPEGDAVAELRGRDLCCWCPLESPCHADVLLELANRETP